MQLESAGWRVWVFALLIVAIGFRLVSWSGRTAIQTDSVAYISSGVNLFSGEGLIDSSGHVLVSKPPLYSLLIGVVWKIIGNGEQAARFVSFLAGIGVVLLILALANRIYSPPIPLVAMAFAAIYPGLVNSSTAALAESLTLFLLLCGTYCLLSLIGTWAVRDAFLSALFFSLAVWSRSNAVLIALSVIPLLLCFLRANPETPPRKVIQSVLVYSLFLVLALQPLMAWNTQHTGKWTLNPESTAWLKVMVESDSQDGRQMEEILSDLGSRSESDITINDILTRDSRGFVHHILRNAYTFYKETLPKEVTLLFIFLSGIGFLVIPKNGYSQLAVLLPFFLPVPVWMIMRGGEPRDVIPLIPAFLLLAGAGSVKMLNWGRELDLTSLSGSRYWGRLFAGTVLTLAVVVCLPGGLRYQLGSQGQEVEHKLMGEWIREHYPPEERSILTRKPMVAFYADGVSQSLVLGGLDDLRLHAVQSKSKFLAIDSRTTAKVYPQYSSLIESGDAPNWLSFVHEVVAPDGERLILYEVVR